MKVLMFSADYWPDIGGIAMHVRYLSRALASLGMEVTVIGGHRAPWPLPGEADLNAHITIQEIPIHRKGPRGVRGAFFTLRAFLRLRQLAGTKWDVAHFHNFFPDGLLLRKWKHAAIRVMTNHSDILLKAIDGRRSLAHFRWLIRPVDGIIAPSPELQEKSRLISHHEQVVKYIPNGVDVDLFAPGKATSEAFDQLKVKRENRILLAVRRHDAKCGLEYLLQAMPRIVNTNPEAVLCLVGDGPQTSMLRRLASSLGISGNLRFVGRVPHSSLPNLYRAAYLSVLPSIYEAVSLAGLESLACACPVVGTRVGGIPEFIHQGLTGLLSEPQSAEDLAEAIQYLLMRGEIRDRMGEEGRKLAVREFSWPAVAKRTSLFYSALLD